MGRCLRFASPWRIRSSTLLTTAIPINLPSDTFLLLFCRQTCRRTPRRRFLTQDCGFIPWGHRRSFGPLHDNERRLPRILKFRLSLSIALLRLPPSFQIARCSFTQRRRGPWFTHTIESRKRIIRAPSLYHHVCADYVFGINLYTQLPNGTPFLRNRFVVICFLL